jgi:hypothetical protein
MAAVRTSFAFTCGCSSEQSSASLLRSQSGDAKKDKAVPEPVDEYSPTQGFLEEFIISDEFFEARFNLLGC